MSKYQESILSGTQVLSSGWMRRIQIKFTSLYSDNLSVTIGDTIEDAVQTDEITGETKNSGYNYTIRVTGQKQLGTGIADGGTITVTNMEPDVLALIIAAKLYKVEIKFGYKSSGSLITFAKGEIAFITQKPFARHDTYTYITYAPESIAKMKQGTIGFFANSGVNMWSILNYLTDNTKCAISPNLTRLALNQAQYFSGTASNIIEQLCKNANTIVSSDSSIGNVLTISNIDEKRVIDVNPASVIIKNGNPTLTSAGLQIGFYPLFNFVPGDILHIDNGLIDISQGLMDFNSVINASDLNSAYIDVNGEYMIQKISYTFENKGEAAEINCLCRAVSALQNLSGE